MKYFHNKTKMVFKNKIIFDTSLTKEQTNWKQPVEAANRLSSWRRRAQRDLSFPVLVVYAPLSVVLAYCRAQSSEAAGGTATATSEASSFLMVDVALQVSGCQECLMPFHNIGVDNHSFSGGVLLLMSCVIR